MPGAFITPYYTDIHFNIYAYVVSGSATEADSAWSSLLVHCMFFYRQMAKWQHLKAKSIISTTVIADAPTQRPIQPPKSEINCASCDRIRDKLRLL